MWIRFGQSGGYRPVYCRFVEGDVMKITLTTEASGLVHGNIQLE